jgi:hypothetical protein
VRVSHYTIVYVYSPYTAHGCVSVYTVDTQHYIGTIHYICWHNLEGRQLWWPQASTALGAHIHMGVWLCLCVCVCLCLCQSFSPLALPLSLALCMAHSAVFQVDPDFKKAMYWWTRAANEGKVCADGRGG